MWYEQVSINQVKRLSRYISNSRRYCLSFDSDEDTKRNGILYTIALACRMHKVNMAEPAFAGSIV